VCLPSGILADADADAPAELEPTAGAIELPAFDGVAASIAGNGRLRAARAVIDDDQQVWIELDTQRGRRTFPVPGIGNNGTDVTLEAMQWSDVVGDDDPELRVAISTYRDPCGCDDGPTFSATYEVVCRATRHGAECSQPILTSSDETIDVTTSFRGEVVITRSGLAHVKIVESERMSRRELRRLGRRQRLFR
jgi:hypothetical protein